MYSTLMVAIKNKATVIFTQEFILDNPSLSECLRESLLEIS